MVRFRLLRSWLGRGAGYLPVLAVVCVYFAPAASLRADTIFSNIAGNCCGGEPVDGTAFDGLSLAEAFTPNQIFELSDVQLVVAPVLGAGDPNFNVYLYSDGGGTPGSLLATLGFNLAAPADGGIVTLPMTSALDVLSGTEYWVVLTAFNADTEISWEAGGTQSVPTALTVPQLDGSWVANNDADLQFEIDGGNPGIPEPGTIILIAAPILLILFPLVRVGFTARLRRRKRSW